MEKFYFLIIVYIFSLEITQNDLMMTGKSRQWNGNKEVFNHDFGAMQYP